MEKLKDHHACSLRIMAIHDTMDVLSGKWKITILSSLGFGKKRYSLIHHPREHRTDRTACVPPNGLYPARKDADVSRH